MEPEPRWTPTDEEDRRLRSLRGTSHPPRDALPVGRPLTTILATAPDAALAVTGADVYPEGLAFRLMVLLPPDRGGDGLMSGGMLGARPRRDEHDPEPGDSLRFSVRFPDGSVSFEPNDDLRQVIKDPDFETRPRLSGFSGSGHGNRWETEFYLTPLPPDGLLDLVCEWSWFDIPETHTLINVTGLAEAAALAVRPWTDQTP